MQCFLRRLGKLYSTAERPKESLVLHVVAARSDEDAIPVTENADGNMPYGCHGGVLPFVRGGLTSDYTAFSHARNASVLQLDYQAPCQFET
jgi:hypothetical protein